MGYKDSKTYLVGRIIIEQCDERYNNNTKDKSNKKHLLKAYVCQAPKVSQHFLWID